MIPPSFRNPCEASKFLATETWNRIYFSRSAPGTKIFETTITQNLLYSILFQQRIYGNLLEIEIQESTEEKRNGSDILLTIQLDDGNYIDFAVQSKIIYHNKRTDLSVGNYPAMNHLVGPRATPVERVQQVDILLGYAATEGMIPMYLLYNFVNNISFTSLHCGHRSSKSYGCSILDPNYVKRNYIDLGRIPTFADLRPTTAVPWCVLFCKTPRDLDSIFGKLNLPKPNHYQVQVKPQRMISENPRWKPVDINLNLKDYFFHPDSNEKIIEFIQGDQFSYEDKYDLDDLKKKKEDSRIFLPTFRVIYNNK